MLPASVGGKGWDLDGVQGIDCRSCGLTFWGFGQRKAGSASRFNLLPLCLIGFTTSYLGGLLYQASCEATRHSDSLTLCLDARGSERDCSRGESLQLG